jgi:hypothetical protein
VIRVAPRDSKKFDVRFDPTRVTVQQMLDAVRQLKYRPSLDGVVSAGVETPALKAEARSADAALGKKSDGAIVITLAPKTDQRLGGEGHVPTRIEVVGTEHVTVPEGKAQVSIEEALTESREVRVPIRVGEQAAAGEQVVTVKVTFQSKRGNRSQPEETIELKVPVVVR